MTNTNIYQNITARTGGDIYLGVVGPVRTGKSTFIKRFMDVMVLPQMEDSAAKKRTVDELPRFGSGENDHDHGTEVYSKRGRKPSAGG